MSEGRKRDDLMEGVVRSAKGRKSITVCVPVLVKHKKYGKYLRRDRIFHVHDAKDEAAEGDRVIIRPTRPLSKTKHWRLVKVVRRAQKV